LCYLILPSRAIGIIVNTSFLVKKLEMNALSSQNLSVITTQKWELGDFRHEGMEMPPQLIPILDQSGYRHPLGVFE